MEKAGLITQKIKKAPQLFLNIQYNVVMFQLFLVASKHIKKYFINFHFILLMWRNCKRILFKRRNKIKVALYIGVLNEI